MMMMVRNKPHTQHLFIAQLSYIHIITVIYGCCSSWCVNHWCSSSIYTYIYYIDGEGGY